ncbi:AAA family ATPase [Candidatus Woesearchaeota archaeon]|nr:AAA family ATPase [Candidatus Woesearchaeota archaeon]
MALFDNMLKADESVFKNETALDFDFIPKIMPYREEQQRYAATCIHPLFQGRNGKNLFIHGPPGIGKTAAIKWVFRDLEEESDEVVPIYINCWQKNTTYKIILEICDVIGYKFTQNKKTDDLFKIIKEMLNKNAAVFCFDEVDKLDDFDFIYMLLEDIYKCSIFMITNFKDFIMDIDDRIKSRLTPETIEFKQYNPKETEGIIRERIKYAFNPGVWDEDALKIVATKTAELKDIRSGLHLLRQAGQAAEAEASRKIEKKHAEEAIRKLDEFSVKKSTDLEDDTRLILDTVKENSGKKIGELFKIYKEKDGKNTYKTFQRKIEKLEKNRFIEVTKTAGGAEGNTSIISYSNVEKKLTDF